MLGTSLLALLSPVFFSGPRVEAVEDVLVALVFLGLAGYNYWLSRNARVLSANSLRAAAIVGLWLVAFSIHVGTGGALTTETTLFGIGIAGVHLYLYRRLG